jgi:hypothetical protein
VGYTEGLLDRLRRAGDPSADALIEELARAGPALTRIDPELIEIAQAEQA